MNIPVFPQFSLIDIASKHFFDDAYRTAAPSTSDTVFSSLFGWQNHFNYYYCSLEKFLLVYYMQDNTMVFLPPLLREGSFEDAQYGHSFLALACVLTQYGLDNDYTVIFRFVPAAYLKHFPLDAFDIAPDRDSFDYVYLREDLVALSGQKYAPKRNLIQQFKKAYAYAYEPLKPENIAAAYDFINRWHFDRKNEMLGEAAYCLACRLLDHSQDLNVLGGMLTVDGVVVAATLGTVTDKFLYDDGCWSTAIVHHENALVSYKGAYQMINQLFCAHLPPAVRYINREEDMGIAGLRKAKESYQPARMIKKYTVQLKNTVQKE